MPIRTLLMDIDDTLCDFHTSSREALAVAFAEHEIPFTEDLLARYETIDAGLWQRFEQGGIEKEALYTERFRLLFAEFGLSADPGSMNRAYFRELGSRRNFMPHCEQALRLLHAKYRIFIVTNGNTDIQNRRIAASGMAQYFDRVFISEQMGCKKPDKLFYDKVFAEIGEEYRTYSIMIGDSLSSDMLGGRNAGIPTCLYGQAEPIAPLCDYAVSDLLDLPPLLASL